MLTTVQRLRIYGLAIMGAVVILSVVFYLQARSRMSDIRLVSALRSLSYALERHYEDFLTYPEGRFDLRKVTELSEDGFKAGQTEYYRGGFKSGRAVTYQSDGRSYRITFRLKNPWPDQGIPGTACVIETNYHLTCAKP